MRSRSNNKFLTGFVPLEIQRTLSPEEGIRARRARVPIFLKSKNRSELLNGFTLLEILISLAVLALMGTIVLLALSRFRISAELDTAVRQTLSVIRLAQSKTLAAEVDSQHGVHFESDRITLFQGANFTPGPTNEVTMLSSLVQITNISLAGGGVDLVFDRLTGRTSKFGSVTFAPVADLSQTRVITIDPSGQTRAEAAELLPGGTRVTDTRHVNFALGWSIRGASTLRIQFSDPPNPDTIQDIAMADYFDVGETVFDWLGTVAVGGSNQTLHIHTAALSASDTTLSVDRDRRTNDKALIIFIDGKEISRYDSSGGVTAGPFGGTMTIQ